MAQDINIHLTDKEELDLKWGCDRYNTLQANIPGLEPAPTPLTPVQYLRFRVNSMLTEFRTGRKAETIQRISDKLQTQDESVANDIATVVGA